MALIDNLLSYWKLEEASGTREDAHGSNDLADNNTVTNAAGIILNGADFEAANSEFLSLDTNLGASPTDISMSFQFWVKPESAPTSGNFFQLMSYNSESTTGWQYFIDYVNDAGTYKLRPARSGSTPGDISYALAGALSTTVFTHIVVTYNGSQIELYINGVSVATDSAAGVTDTGTLPNFFRMGQYRDGNGNVLTRYWDGIIDEVGIWTRALSAAEVTSLYNGGAGLAYPLAEESTGNFFLLF